MTNLNMIFHMVVSVYRLVKIFKLAPVSWWISERLIWLHKCRLSFSRVNPDTIRCVWTGEFDFNTLRAEILNPERKRCGLKIIRIRVDRALTTWPKILICISGISSGQWSNIFRARFSQITENFSPGISVPSEFSRGISGIFSGMVRILEI